MNSIVAARSALLSPEEALAGNTTLSLETQAEGSDDLLTVVRSNPKSFLRAIQFLDPADRELLLLYFCCSKAQHNIATFLDITQTFVSAWLRQAIKRMGGAVLLGGYTRQTLEPVFKEAHLEGLFRAVPTSRLITDYADCRDFNEVAQRYDLRREDIRREMRFVVEKFEDSPHTVRRAVAAYVDGLLMGANIRGWGKRDSMVARDRFFTDPPILGEFYWDITDAGFDEVFNPASNPG